MVVASARHLLGLINDILDISRIEAGQLEIEEEAFLLPGVLDEVIRGLEPMAKEKGLKITQQITSNLNVIVSDRRRVEQILINLIGNAVKFTDVGEVCVECYTDDPWLVVRIKDTGIGIAPQDMGRLFEPFQQADSGPTRSHDGTGLGLAICKRLVELLGGIISAESQHGVGSTFSFKLPLGGRSS